jgi:hypothetical protein
MDSEKVKKLKEEYKGCTLIFDEAHMYKKILYSPEAVDRIVEYFKGE